MSKNNLISSSPDWFRCPECKLKNVRYRAKFKDYVCNRCGTVFIVVKDQNHIKAKPKKEVRK